MANSPSAIKRARQAEKQRLANVDKRSEMRTTIKKVINAIAAGNKEDAQNNFKQAVSKLDRMVSNGLIHENKAARHKSRLNKQVKALA